MKYRRQQNEQCSSIRSHTIRRAGSSPASRGAHYLADYHGRLAHIHATPRVALHFDGNGRGGDIVVLTGEAHLSPDDLPADQHAAYLDKYQDFIARSFGTPANFAAKYSMPLRITPTKVRGH
jgi:PPOX class probable F420-dependent enzyme